ncbi:MFS transporter [Phytomonospora endophytica]|uniref:Putative MFS family arabinose efflux permease n=1 Tax=Phytomonospora endophytica TaxID=714109 RepID=A0A841FJL5_9ACTN|nr:MFS transporter [Phytomonospora endophytica]MBB6036376.1 putative MFS family arabinose efflux permease [Phytomonospora endophytica]GIG65697.1 MFS transporter [Phytomonospora endophytica]
MSTPPTTRRTGWPAVLAVATATFTVVTSEMLPVGLLTPLASALDVSEGTAGLTMTVPGLVAAVAAPTVVRATRRLDRRRVLIVLTALLAGANIVSALASDIGVLLAARVLVGVSIGGVWAVAVPVTARLVSGPSAARANATVFSGIAVASVFGVPLGTWIGGLADWRAAFAAGAVLAAVVAAALAVLLPPLPPVDASGGARKVRNVRLALAVVAALVAGHFAAYTYVRPLLEQVGGLGEGAIGVLLLVYGVAGVAGNFVAGTLAAKFPNRTVTVIAAFLGTVLLIAPLLTRGLFGSAAVLVAWGLAYGGVSVATQVWLFSRASGPRESVSALLSAVFNTAIAGGAFVGGVAADAVSVPGAVWLGAGLLAVAFLTAASAMSRRPPSAAHTPAALPDEPDRVRL